MAWLQAVGRAFVVVAMIVGVAGGYGLLKVREWHSGMEIGALLDPILTVSSQELTQGVSVRLNITDNPTSKPLPTSYGTPEYVLWAKAGEAICLDWLDVTVQALQAGQSLKLIPTTAPYGVQHSCSAAAMKLNGVHSGLLELRLKNAKPLPESQLVLSRKLPNTKDMIVGAMITDDIRTASWWAVRIASCLLAAGLLLRNFRTCRKPEKTALTNS